MNRRFGFLNGLTALAVVVLFCATAFAGTTGKITGVVTDSQSGDPLPNASVAVLETDLGTVSDEDGKFFILNVSPGTYTLKVTYIGYSAYTIENVRVSTDLTTDLKFELTSKAIQAEEVVVRAERPIIDKNATNAVHIIGGEDLEILPFRGVQNVLSLQAGVVEQEGALHIRGSRSDEIAYYVEGASVRNVITGFSAVELNRRGHRGDPAAGGRLQRRIRRRQCRHHSAGAEDGRERLEGRVELGNGQLRL